MGKMTENRKKVSSKTSTKIVEKKRKCGNAKRKAVKKMSSEATTTEKYNTLLSSLHNEMKDVGLVLLFNNLSLLFVNATTKVKWDFLPST